MIPYDLHSKRLTAGLAAAALLFGAALPLTAADFRFEPFAPSPVSAKTAGSAGPYAAQVAGFDTLFTNPAALAYVDSAWSIARVSMSASGPLFDLPSAFLADDIETEMLGLVADNNGIYVGSGITGPIAFGKVDKNFGFGIFNDTTVVANIPSLTKASILAGEDFLLTGAYGLELLQKKDHSLSLGLQLKGYFQTFVSQSGTATQILSTATSLDVNGIPMVLSTGFGLDGGLMYRYGTLFSAGLVCRDLYTPAFSTRYANLDDYLAAKPDAETISALLPMNLSAGVAFSVPLPDRWLTVSSWDFMFDYRDILAWLEPIQPNPVLYVNLGTEMVLLDVVSLRAGINETYLAAGLGLNLTVCKIDFAFYGSELGIEPGKRPLLNMDISVSFEY